MKRKLIIFLGIVCVAIIAIAATSVSSTRLDSNLTVYEDIVSNTINQNLTHNSLNESVNYKDGAPRHDVDLVYSDTVKNTQTVDLTSLVNTLGQALDLTAQRVVAVKFKSRLTNAGTIQIEPGAANGYDLLGATFKITLEPAQSLLFKCDTMLDVIGATDKTLLFTCGNDTLDLILITADLI